MATNREVLNQSLSWRYDIVFRKELVNGQQRFVAYTRELDPDVIYGIGETREEAEKSLNKVKEAVFEHYIQRGVEIPRPLEDERLPSGKFVVRTQPRVHAKLLRIAKRDKVSLNTLVHTLLANYTTMDELAGEFASEMASQLRASIHRAEDAWFRSTRHEMQSFADRGEKIYGKAA